MVRVRCAAIRGLGAARNCGSWEPRNNGTYQPIAARQAVAFLVDGELTGCRVRSRIEAVDVPPIQRNPGLAPGVSLFLDPGEGRNLCHPLFLFRWGGVIDVATSISC